MALKKDKQKVLGETFDDNRVRGFLEVTAVGENSADYSCLENAYRGMNIENFKTFVGFFVEEGKNLNGTNADGETLLQVISTHRHAGPYIEALKAAGANY